MNKILQIAGLLLLTVFASSAAQSVTLAWNANTETNLAGYRLYWGLATRNYTALNNILVPSTTSTVTNLLEGATYYFAVTAYTDDGLESDYSDEVFYTVPLIAPVGLVINGIANNGKTLTLNWSFNEGPNFGKYNVLVGNKPGIYNTNYFTVNKSYTFNDLTSGQRYYFAVEAVTTNGVSSGASGEVAHIVPLNKVVGLRIQQ